MTTRSAWGVRMVRSIAGVVTAAAVAVGALALTPSTACAQARVGMNAGMGGMGQRPISSRELKKWFEIAGMTPEQQEAVKTLHEAYREEHAAQTKAMEDLVKKAQADFMETQDMSSFKDIGDKSSAISEKITALDKQLMEDAKAILTAEQAERWPRVERHHRRAKSLPSGMLAAESANLVNIVNDLKIEPPSQELRDALDQYEIDLDKALTERDAQRKVLEKQGQEMMKDFDPSKMDFSKIRQMMADVRKTGIAVREVNLRHARLLAGAVPSERKSDFDDRARKALYPRIYKESYTAQTIDAALKFDDLTEDQRAKVGQLQESYRREAVAANERWVAAVIEEEKDGGGDPFMGFGRMVPGGSDEKLPTDEPKKARRELDNATVDKLKALLTDDQKARLPEKEPENPWMNFGGGNDDEADEQPVKSRTEKRNR